MRELNGELRKVSYLHAEECSALDLNVMRARYWSTKWPLPGTVEEREEVFEKETHKTYQCRCWTREGEKCTDFFETYNAGVAHEVRALWLGSTHGLKLHVTTMTISHRCPMCETVFFEFDRSANSCSASVSKREMFYESIRSSVRLEEKSGNRSTFCMSRPRVQVLFNEIGLFRRHIKRGHLNKWLPGQVHTR